MIPKSLHTVTALVNVARRLHATGAYPANIAAGSLISEAARVLGYGIDTPDPHGLLAAATYKLAAKVSR
jgi:hypothetical protein